LRGIGRTGGENRKKERVISMQGRGVSLIQNEQIALTVIGEDEVERGGRNAAGRRKRIGAIFLERTRSTEEVEVANQTNVRSEAGG